MSADSESSCSVCCLRNLIAHGELPSLRFGIELWDFVSVSAESEDGRWGSPTKRGGVPGPRSHHSKKYCVRNSSG